MKKTLTKTRNISNFLREEVSRYVKHYQEDLNLDLDKMKLLFQADAKDNDFYILLRTCGTNSFRIRDVYLKNTFPHTAFTYYADPSYGYDDVIAYSVHIGKVWGGDLMGTVKKIPYKKVVEDVLKYAVEPGACKYFFADGSVISCDKRCDECQNCIIAEKVSGTDENEKAPTESGVKILYTFMLPEEDENDFNRMVKSHAMVANY
jgi:hypothetical protein